MTLSRLFSSLALLVLICLVATAAAPPRRKQPPPPSNLLPLAKLAPAKLFPEQCLLRYRISTKSEKCQAYFDQALGYYYSYVWMEAARSFETALQHDPDCAMAWWGLSRAQSRWGRGDHNKSCVKAWELREHASSREQFLLKAMMQEKGQMPGVGKADERVQKAIATLDEMLAQYDDDEEAWYYRGQLAAGKGIFGGKAASVPFYKALLRINPLHPGANHELVHFYENFQRPALGWPYAEAYIESSPGIPHPFHMQAHLATRLGRWQKTSDRSARAIELQRAYHKREGVKPTEDWQYSHHLEILLISLTHDGRFREARDIERECNACNFRLPEPIFRLHLAQRDYDAALKIADEIKQGGKGKGKRGRPDKTLGSYLAALVHLHKGEAEAALPEIQVLQQAWRDSKTDPKVELRLYEAQGLYLCMTGDGAAGLKLLQKAVDKTKNSFGHHAWGNGARYMESWGIGALAANKLDVAEEAFLESLAHDPGSVRAALGMQLICERQGRAEESERFSVKAKRCWSKADPGHLVAEMEALRGGKNVRPDASKGKTVGSR